jgi:hypothetical protein
MKTNFEAQCKILASIWLEHRQDEDLEDFVEYNDLGLPLAYFISEGVVSSTRTAKAIINETFDILLDTFELEDTGFNNFDEILLQLNR